MESVAWTSLGLAETALMSFGGLPADAICWDYNAPDAVSGQVGGFRLSAAVHEADMIGPIAHAQRAVPGFGRAHKARMREVLGRVVAVGATGESLPHPKSYVDLDPGARDRGGQRVARIHSYVDAPTIRRLRFMARTCRELLRASGAATLVEEFGTWDHFSASHVFGTCRMGGDPRHSVVDARQRLHGWDNVWVCDASVFPSTGGGEAPSLTIQALALRAVDAMG
jgi:choline dehydrogenase-like flavoprotein